MKLTNLTVIFAMMGIIFIGISCQHEGIPADQMEQICFKNQVLPILQVSCAECHNANDPEGGYNFSDTIDFSFMKGFVPYNSSKSTIYKAITSQFELMPPHNPLPMDKRIIIRLWIDQGAKIIDCAPEVNLPNNKSVSQWACYETDIQPIFNSSCAVTDCHNSITRKEGIDLSSYANAFALIKPGNPENSKIYEAITEDPNEDDFMPHEPYSPLSKAAIDTIYSWIKRGGLYEKCSTACDTTGIIAYSTHIKPIIDLSCASCHGANNPSGGINLLTEANVQSAAKSGKLLAVTQRKGTIVMPPSYALADCQVKEIELWIKQGYN